MTYQKISVETGLDPSTPPEVAVFSYYRNAEQHGANLLFRLLRRMNDPDAQIMLSEHLADETRHAWLWTQRIVRSGHKPLAVQDGYQTRIGKAAGLPVFKLLGGRTSGGCASPTGTSRHRGGRASGGRDCT
ncbi:MAG: hypothetical protein ABGY41_02810, partial [Candidatus Poribacteria bacterium]